MESTLYNSPVGVLEIISDGRALTALRFTQKKFTPVIRKCPILKSAVKQLDEYFARKRESFDLPLKPDGTKFQMRVWEGLSQIPFGGTCSYGDIARRIRRPLAQRAVGGANNKNPIAIIIPCHRVIGRDQKLVGYGGGLHVKEWLLKHEGFYGRARA